MRFIEIMNAYDEGRVTGPQTPERLKEVSGAVNLGKALFMLGFTKKFNEDGTVLYHPPPKPRRGQSRWPQRCELLRGMVNQDIAYVVASRVIKIHGVEVVGRALEKMVKNPSGDQSIEAVAAEISRENSSLAAKAAEEVITKEELAMALRENPALPKEALLNRTRGLVRAATRKGNWEDSRPTYLKERENNNATA